MPGVTRAGGPIMPAYRRPQSAPPPDPVLPTAAELAIMQEDGDFDIDEILDAPAELPADSHEEHLRVHEEFRAKLVEYPPVSAWEELTVNESGYLLRHDGQLYVAVLVDGDSIISQALGRG